MKETNKLKLLELLQKENIEQFRKELQVVLFDEVRSINIPRKKLNEILDLVQYIEIPLNISRNIQYIEHQSNNNANIPTIVVASVTGVILSSILRRMPLVLCSVLSIGGAVSLGYGLNKLQKNEKVKQSCTIIEKIDSTIEEITNEIDKVIILVTILTQEKKIQISDQYPNILKWFQLAYTECNDFGDQCSIHFKKRIENVLYESYYILHNYDGTNEDLFEKTEDSDIQEITQDLPAITNKNGYILPGHLFVPLTNK
jgi:uncharacterized protein YcfJ